MMDKAAPTKRFARVILVSEQGHVLAVTHREGECNFPGGKIEPGESPEDAARREVFEETGVMPGEMKLACSGTYPLGNDLWEGYFYMADTFEGLSVNREPEKFMEVAFHDSVWLAEHGPQVFVGAILAEAAVTEFIFGRSGSTATGRLP